MRLRRVGQGLAVALLLGGCVPYRLGAADALNTNAQLQSQGVVLRGRPVSPEVTGPAYVITPETLQAGFGDIALTRVESDPARPLIVFCGGNLERQDVRGAMRFQELSPFGDVWLFDFPGYGRTEGQGTPADFAALNAALARRIDQAYAPGGRTGDLVFWGLSFGGGVCAKLAATVRTPSHVVLVATFPNFETVVKTRAGPVGWLVRPVIGADLLNIDVVETLADHEGAIAVVAALDDQTVPYRASLQLQRALAARGRRTRMVTLDSAVHADIQKAPAFRPALQEAFEQLGVGRPR